MVTKLVITSDDLGMSLSVNRGITAAMACGAVTTTNVMVPCPWFEHAAATFQYPNVDLGVHLTLTCEWRHYTWRPLTLAPSLMDSNDRMHPTIEALMQCANAEDIRRECRRQIEIALRRGLPISYVDVHMCIPCIEPSHGDAGRAANPVYELALMRIIEGVADEFGLPYPYALSGERLKYFRSALSISGKARASIEQYIRSLEPGVHHLSCHCAVQSSEQAVLTSEADPALPWALDYRLEDLECITSDWFKALLSDCGIELVRMPFARGLQSSKGPSRPSVASRRR